MELGALAQPDMWSRLLDLHSIYIYIYMYNIYIYTYLSIPKPILAGQDCQQERGRAMEQVPEGRPVPCLRRRGRCPQPGAKAHSRQGRVPNEDRSA